MSPSPRASASSLQGLEDRLRLLYDTAGSFGIEWEPKISLSVDAGNLLGPGCNLFRGRRWTWYTTDAAAAATQIAVSFQTPAVVTQFWINGNAAYEYIVGIKGSGEANLIPTAFGGPFFTEHFVPSVQSEFAPMRTSAWQALGAPGTGQTYISGQTGSQGIIWPVEWFLPGQLPDQTPGNLHQIIVTVNAAHALGVKCGMSGYLF